MRRRVIISLLSIFLSASIDTVFAQEVKTPRRIGWLGFPIPARYEAFRQGMRDLGYIEGQNFVIALVDTGANSRLPDAVAELIRRNAEVIVTTGSPAVFAAKQATSTIPIVMTTGGDPVALGLIASLAHPGGNVTGLTSISNDLAAKRLDLLKETIPKLVRVGVLWNPDDPSPSISFKETESAARGFGMQLQPLRVRSPSDFEGAFKTATAKRLEALVILQTALINNQIVRIIELATKNRLPTMFGEGLQVESGGLMSYAPNSPDLFRRAATFVDKILKGRKPADLPVEQPTKFEFVINLKTAKQIGLTIPPNVLVRADKVIK
jgi:putative tryptophan/tyrosine transport system substrate-binding protein